MSLAGFKASNHPQQTDKRGAVDAVDDTPPPATGRDTGEAVCECPPCPGRGNDGHRMTHCAECCFGTGVIADLDCPTHGEPPAPQAGASVEASEPPGLGAVVTDIRGKRWVRDANYRDRWYCPADGTRADWPDLVRTVTQVESIGVRDA